MQRRERRLNATGTSHPPRYAVNPYNKGKCSVVFSQMVIDVRGKFEMACQRTATTSKAELQAICKQLTK
jgi:hypothetical protein